MQRAINRKRRSIPAMLPAPIGGLNGRDTYATMPEQDAFVLDNWFPNSTSVDLRGGTLNFATGMPGACESLAVYTGGAGDKLLAFSNGNIYDATAGGAVGAAIKTGMASSKVTTAMFSNAATQFLLIYSGSDQPLSYDGAAIANLTITGLTGSQNTLHSPHAFKGRIFLAQANQLGFYYLAVGAIQGAASYFDLSQVSGRGGAIQSITSFSQGDTGVGPQDYALFVTTKGEYILYAGTDPSSAATWTLVGRYYSATPVGRKGWFKFRSDVYFITEDGVISFSEIRQTGEEPAQFITAKLGRKYTNADIFKTAHGWCGIVYPRKSMLIVNVPFTGILNGEYVQFAMNTNTNAWGRFLNVNALDWVIFNDRAYYGAYDGKVILFDEGFTDNGAQITAVGRQAWNTFTNEKIGLGDKQYHVAQLVLKAVEIPAISCNVNVNFEDDQPTPLPAVMADATATWDVSAWDDSFWAGTLLVKNLDVFIGKIGYVASLWIELGSPYSGVEWLASRILFEPTTRAFP